MIRIHSHAADSSSHIPALRVAQVGQILWPKIPPPPSPTNLQSPQKIIFLSFPPSLLTPHLFTRFPHLVGNSLTLLG